MGKIEKSFYWFCFFLAVYIVIGFKLIPIIIKDQLIKNLDENLLLKTTVQRVEFNPFIAQAKVHNLALVDEKNKKIISFSEFTLNIALLRSIFEAHISLDEILLKDPIVDVVEDLDGNINLSKLVKETEVKEELKEDESSLDIKFLISKIKLENLNINYTKITKDKPYHLSIENSNYTLYDVGTYKNILASNDLKLNINKHTKLIVTGAFNVSPFKMYGKAQIIDLRLKEILDQQKEIIDFDINEEASLDLAINYNIDIQKDFNLKFNTSKLELNNINMSKNKEDIIKLNKLLVSKLDFDLLTQDVKLNDIQIKDLYTKLIIDKSGVNLANLFKSSTSEKKTTTKDGNISTPTKPWNILLTNLKQTNSDFVFTDKTSNIAVNTKKFSTNVSSVNVAGSDITVNNFKISNPNIEYLDNNNSMLINSDNSKISFDKLAIANDDINISNINIEKNNFSFKDTKSALDINLNKPNININSLKIKGSDIYINKINVNTPKILFEDSKNKMNIQMTDTTLITNDLNIIKSIVSITSIKLDTPSLKLNDKANSLELDMNKINGNINSFLLNKDDISIKTVNIKQGVLKLRDNKNKLNIDSEQTEVNINKIKQNKDLLSLESLRIYNPNILLINKKDKTNIIAKNIDISVTNISNSKNGLKVSKANISKPNISVILEKNTSKAEIKEVVEKKKDEKSAKLNIGPININDATLSFEDKNLPLPFKTIISKLNGKVSKLDTTIDSTSRLKVNGIVDKYGTTQITGILDPKNIKILTDINMIFKNISMQNFTPYTGKFIGKELKSGKLDLDLKYNIKKSNLDAKNNILITKLELGKKVESKDAVSLPLELAITLLEDSNGIIDLNIPVSGNMDDPKFAIGPIVWKAFVNLITKAITAPFSLLGSIFGFDADEINSVNFNYGEKDITPIQKETLDKISIILQKRPNLVLAFNPSYNKDKDLLALKTMKFNKFISNELGNRQKKDYKENYLALLEEVYEDFDQKLKLLQEKYLNDKKAYKNTLESFIISKQKVNEEDLPNLALSRINNIKNYLLETKKIPAKQIKVSKKINIKTSNINLTLSK